MKSASSEAARFVGQRYRCSISRPPWPMENPSLGNSVGRREGTERGRGGSEQGNLPRWRRRREVGGRLVGGRRDLQHGLERAVVAGAELTEAGAGGGLLRERGAREHIVDAPADVALFHVPPWRPPGEEPVVVGRELAAQIDEAMAEDLREELALLRRGADLVLFAQ